MDYTNISVAGNHLGQILGCFAAILISFIIGKISKVSLKKIGDRNEQKGKLYRGLLFICISETITFICITFGLYIGVKFLTLGTAAEFIDTSIAVIFCLTVAHTLWVLVEVPCRIFYDAALRTESKMDDMLAPIIRKSLRLLIVLLALVQIAQFLSGKDLTAILTSLGIGGLAVALAAQDTIKNFFGSVVILTDKPFELNDRINVDGHDGTVEEVGLRSTRIRRLDGHLVTFPNGELANKAIHNIAKRPFIRRVFDVTITYDTPPEKVTEGKKILEDILHNHEGMAEDFPPRVYFKELASTSLTYMVIYWYHPPAYWDYMAFSERVNMEILTRFNEAGIEFAFPTQTVYLAGDPNRPLFPDRDVSPSLPSD